MLFLCNVVYLSLENIQAQKNVGIRAEVQMPTQIRNQIYQPGPVVSPGDN